MAAASGSVAAPPVAAVVSIVRTCCELAVLESDSCIASTRPAKKPSTRFLRACSTRSSPSSVLSISIKCPPSKKMKLPPLEFSNNPSQVSVFSVAANVPPPPPSQHGQRSSGRCVVRPRRCVRSQSRKSRWGNSSPTVQHVRWPSSALNHQPDCFSRNGSGR